MTRCRKYDKMTRIVFLLLMLIVCDYSIAQDSINSECVDSVPIIETHTKFNYRQLAVPSVMIAVGAFGVSNNWFVKRKTQLRDKIGAWRGDNRFRIDDYAQYLPVVSNVLMGCVGVKSRHSFKERVAVTATAYAAMGIMVNGVKWMVNERRPDSSNLNSFPSGHTATAFMGAELIRVEYGNVFGTIAYVFSTCIGLLRIYNDRHWLNDVIAGAGFGILSARIGYWLLPFERRLFGWKKSKPAVVVSPFYNPNLRDVGLAVSVAF